MSISAVVINRNGRRTLPAVLNALHALPPGALAEILVVDMASSDASRTWLEARTDITLLRLAKHSWSRAANMGVRAATGSRILILSGCTVPEGEADGVNWLDLLCLCLEQVEDTAVAGARLITPVGRIINEGRNFITGLGLNAYSANTSATRFDGPDAAAVRLEADGVDGRLMLFERAVYDAVGGFDENYQPDGTAVDDFCFHARYKDYRVAVCPAARGVVYEPLDYPGLQNDASSPAAILQKKDQIREGITREQALVWKEKWGFNPLFPDLGELRRLYGGTRVCWNIDHRHRFDPERWPPSVDLCMVVWNAAGHIDRCLESLAATDYPADLLTLWVADNGSTDATLERLEHWRSRLPFALNVLELPVNTGAVPAMNYCLSRGRADIAVKMDDDIITPPDWLGRLTMRFLQRPYAGVVGAKILDDSPQARIQCGPISQPPFGNDEEGREDEGQLDQVERCLHVRGCCCLYRRDALRKVGLLDIHYAPSQFDDIDHHIAFWRAGFEVLYDGGVTIRHKLSTGGQLTRQSCTNAVGNSSKLYLKWTAHAINALDIAINCSKEGRVVRAAPLAIAPEPPEKSSNTPGNGEDAPVVAARAEGFPRNPHHVARRAAPICTALGEMIDTALGGVADLGPTYLYITRQREAEGYTGLAFDAADTGLALCPDHAPLLREFAALAAGLGKNAQAAATARRARALEGDAAGSPLPEAALPDPSSPTPPPSGTNAYTLTPDMADALKNAARPRVRPVIATPRVQSVPHGPLAGKRVLVGPMPTGAGSLESGFGAAVARRLANLAAAAGAEVVEWNGHAADLQAPGGGVYDIVHLLGLEPVFRASGLIAAARALNPGCRVILTPLLKDRVREQWAGQVLPRLFREGMADRSLEAKLNALIEGKELYGVKRDAPVSEPVWGHRELLARCLEGADVITHVDAEERKELRRLGAQGVLMPLLPALLPPTEEALAALGSTPPDMGADRFILSVGALEPADNLPMLCVAAQACGLKIAHVGPCADPEYIQLCRKLSPGARFFDQPDEALLGHLLNRAAVYAAPGLTRSWPLLGMAAALRGVPVLLAQGQPEASPLGQSAFVANPFNPMSIIQALSQANNEKRNSPRLAKARALAEAILNSDALAAAYLGLEEAQQEEPAN